MASVQLIFSFDSEDYVTPEAADAEKWWAEAMTRHGITACVCLVAELARRLHETGRDDVLDAWQPHEIAYHTDFHSRPPSPAQYLDPCGWEDGIAEALAREGKGVADLEALTGRHPSAFCKPGSSWGPQVCPAMARLDVPVFSDGPFEWGSPERPLWYAGQMMLSYHCHFDGYMDREEGRLERMKRDFEARLDRHRGSYLIMYTHPCRLNTAEFWDGVNFRAGADPPRSQWRPAPLRPPESVAAMQRDFDAFLAWVVTLPEVELTTYRRFYAERKEPPARGVSREAALSLLASVTETPDAIRRGGVSYSPAELLGLAAALFGRAGSRLPESVPLRRLLGPSEESPVLEETSSPSASDLAGAFRQADGFMTETGRIPASAEAGRAAVGPGTLLRASSALARAALAGESPGTVPLAPGPELPAFASAAPVERLGFRNGWIVFPPDFDGENVVRLAKLQTWTAKPVF